uniref:Uncharacterized protein n=1 Tax=uncultured marine virus TaxID=186617 RepID=A0A0F7L3E5_9VIRU|nr:hypothetical protein [uncultured marine virus]
MHMLLACFQLLRYIYYLLHHIHIESFFHPFSCLKYFANLVLIVNLFTHFHQLTTYFKHIVFVVMLFLVNIVRNIRSYIDRYLLGIFPWWHDHLSVNSQRPWILLIVLNLSFNKQHP